MVSYDAKIFLALCSLIKYVPYNYYKVQIVDHITSSCSSECLWAHAELHAEQGAREANCDFSNCMRGGGGGGGQWCNRDLWNMFPKEI